MKVRVKLTGEVIDVCRGFNPDAAHAGDYVYWDSRTGKHYTPQEIEAVIETEQACSKEVGQDEAGTSDVEHYKRELEEAKRREQIARDTIAKQRKEIEVLRKASQGKEPPVENTGDIVSKIKKGMGYIEESPRCWNCHHFSYERMVVGIGPMRFKTDYLTKLHCDLGNFPTQPDCYCAKYQRKA